VQWVFANVQCIITVRMSLMKKTVELLCCVMQDMYLWMIDTVEQTKMYSVNSAERDICMLQEIKHKILT